jgi:hypothetical protein
MVKSTRPPVDIPESTPDNQPDLRGAKFALRHLKSKKASKIDARATLICELFEEIAAARANKASWADIADTLAAQGIVTLSAVALSKGYEEEKRRIMRMPEVAKEDAQSESKLALVADSAAQHLLEASFCDPAQGGL